MAFSRRILPISNNLKNQFDRINDRLTALEFSQGGYTPTSMRLFMMNPNAFATITPGVENLESYDPYNLTTSDPLFAALNASTMVDWTTGSVDVNNMTMYFRKYNFDHLVYWVPIFKLAIPNQIHVPGTVYRLSNRFTFTIRSFLNRTGFRYTDIGTANFSVDDILDPDAPPTPTKQKITYVRLITQGGGYDKCTRCNGTGKIEPHECTTCNGTGQRVCSECGGLGHIEGSICYKCRGDGSTPCTHCSGTGLCDHCPDGICAANGCNSGLITCNICGGTGVRDAQDPCLSCHGSGKTTCTNCKGAGTTTKCETCGGDGRIDKPTTAKQADPIYLATQWLNPKTTSQIGIVAYLVFYAPASMNRIATDVAVDISLSATWNPTRYIELIRETKTV